MRLGFGGRGSGRYRVPGTGDPGQSDGPLALRLPLRKHEMTDVELHYLRTVLGRVPTQAHQAMGQRQPVATGWQIADLGRQVRSELAAAVTDGGGSPRLQEKSRW